MTTWPRPLRCGDAADQPHHPDACRRQAGITESGRHRTGRRLLLKWVLLANGIVDLAAGAMLVAFPALGLRIPGNEMFEPVAAFTAGGWGVMMFALGIGRTWAAFVPRVHRMWGVVGLLEASLLLLFSVLSVFLTPVSINQALMPVVVGAVFSVLYGWSLLRRRPADA